MFATNERRKASQVSNNNNEQQKKDRSQTDSQYIQATNQQASVEGFSLIFKLNYILPFNFC